MWDRETKTKAKGLLANLKTFGFIFTFVITKNSHGTLKPIAAKRQQKDQDVFEAYSMIDDTVARVTSNMKRNVMTALKTRLDRLTRLALQSKNHWEAGTKSVA